MPLGCLAGSRSERPRCTDGPLLVEVHIGTATDDSVMSTLIKRRFRPDATHRLIAYGRYDSFLKRTA
jgi:hypothetical protein